MYLELGPEQGIEEAEALDVIHVEVREKQIDAAHVTFDLLAEGPDAVRATDSVLERAMENLKTVLVLSPGAAVPAE